MIIIDVLGDAEESSTVDEREASDPIENYFDIMKIPQLQIVELSRDDRPHIVTPAQTFRSVRGIYNRRGGSVN
jgi:hypothetical protein